jgi:hypothetical protein
MNMHFPASWDVIQSISVEACTTSVVLVRKPCGNIESCNIFAKVLDVNENCTENTDFCKSFKRISLIFHLINFVWFYKIFLKRSSVYFLKNVKTKIFVSNLGKTLLLLLFLSPGARKFFILTKISQEIQIFARAFRG